jgi:phosphoglycerol transferase MdoB-like AlkP superfamily enzyme
MTILLDLSPVGGGIGIFAAVAFFLIFLAVAFIAFKMLKKTVKMAFRMAIVVVILAVAVAGSIALWALSGGGGGERPRPTRPR